MTLPRRKYSSPCIRVFSLNQLDPSSAWAQEDYAIIPLVTSEPYDWTLEDDAVSPTQLIPIPPPILNGSATLWQPKRKGDLPETSILIPIEKVSSAERAIQIAIQNRVEPRRKHLASSVLLLLLSVVALFVFAYITQK